MARQRTSPYLSGTTSRLWRFIPTTPAKASALPDPRLVRPDPPSAAAPVVALIRRLPLLFDE
jgi:hypothetical protein